MRCREFALVAGALACLAVLDPLAGRCGDETVLVGGLCESPCATETAKVVVRERLGNFLQLSYGPWTAEKLDDLSAFCRTNGIVFTMDEVLDRRKPVPKEEYAGKLDAVAAALRRNADVVRGSYVLHETGGVMFAWPKAGVAGAANAVPEDVTTWSGADAHLQMVLRRQAAAARKAGMPEPYCSDEPNFGVFSHLLRSGAYGSVDIEVIYGDDLERVFAGAIGATRAFGKAHFGADMATQWYGGNQHDGLWRTRCRSSYYHAFLRGANPVFSEHGIMDYKAMGKDLPFDHPDVKYYRDVLAEVAAYAAAHPRGGNLPDAAVAAIQGRFDGYVSAWQTHLWGKRTDDRFLIGDPDRAWSLFDGLYRRNPWEGRNPQGDVDYSGNPPLGTAEIMPFDAPDEVYARHRTLFFLGRNVMDRVLYDRLIRYVRGGGTLILAASHFDTADSPTEPFTPFNGGDWSELVGLRAVPGRETRMPFGIKFTDRAPRGWKVNSWGPVCDPWFTDGGYRMPVFENAGARALAVASGRFWDKSLDGLEPVLFVHDVGRGQVVFMPTLDSPGAPGSRPLYGYLLARAMEAVDVWPKVECTDRVRWSSYDGGRCIYLLNTEGRLEEQAVVRRGPDDPGQRLTLKPGEFREVRPPVVAFEPGRSEIVIAADACDAVRLAAEDAREILSQALGADVPVVTAPTEGRTALVLGPNAWADAAGVTTNGLKRDAFRIRTAPGRVYVVGLDDPTVNAHANRKRGGIWYQNFQRATAFGVYDFLERFAGVRFYFPGELGTVVPRCDRIEVPPTDLTEAPANTVRRYTLYDSCPYFEGGNRTELRHPMKTLNWWRARMETEYMPCCHGQTKFKYAERFAKSHPEYFALRADGRRYNSPDVTQPGHPWQLCHTSAVWDEFYEDVKSYLSGEDASRRKVPVDATLPGGRTAYGWGVNCQRREIVDVMPEDGLVQCACGRCKAEWAKAPEIGWASDLIWGNTVKLANRLKADGVKGRVSMMAYSKYRRVPDFPFPDNIEVMVAERGPWTEADAPERARELREIRAWTEKIGRKVTVWNYVNKPRTLPDVPNCTPKAIGRYYQEIAPMIYGAFLQNLSDNWICEYLNRYVFGKVMWNPSVDVEALLDEHHRLMFGAAAPEMKRFFEEIERLYVTRVAGRTLDTALGPQSEVPSPYELFVRIYSPETVDTLAATLDRAASCVPADSLEARRIALVRREMFDPLARRTRAYVASIDVEKGLARDRASKRPNLVPQGTLVGGKRLVCDGARADFGVTLRDGNGKPTLRPGVRYRLSYCIKLQNLRPMKLNGGAYANVWAGENFWLPGNRFSGTQDWTYQSFEFTAGAKTLEKGPPMLNFRIRDAVGEIWIDHVRIEELD